MHGGDGGNLAVGNGYRQAFGHRAADQHRVGHGGFAVEVQKPRPEEPFENSCMASLRPLFRLPAGSSSMPVSTSERFVAVR